MRSLCRTLFAGLIATLALGVLASTAAASETPPEATAPSEVATEPADAGGNGFRLNGKLNPGYSPTTYYFEYIADNAYECVEVENCWPETAHAGPITGDSQEGVGSIEVTGLRLGETYRYRLVAENAKGTERGQVLTFTVTHAFPASVGSESISNVTENGATLEAQVNPHGEDGSYRTTWVFEYGTSAAYGQSIPTPPGLFNSEACRYDEDVPCTLFSSPQPVSESLTGLAPATTYHYRIAATNSWGTSYGRDAIFTTAPLSTEVGTPSNVDSDQSTSSPMVAGLAPLVISATPITTATTTKPKITGNALKLDRALEACARKAKKQRARCVRHARKEFGQSKKAKK